MFLPHELIILILLRLPVKSLIRFKCVCKLWFSLISHDSNFANSHFQLNSATPTRRILFLSNSTQESRSVDFEASLGDDSASVSLNLDFMFPEDFTDFEIKGSCRGFVLICGSLNFCLWNPTTGLHKQIPLSPIGSNLDEADCFYGFGYDHSTQDYLVVSMSFDSNADVISTYLEFFSLRDNTWKQIEGTYFPYMNASNYPIVGSLFNGAIHWLALHIEITMYVIVSFDLNERKLLDMSLPDDFEINSHYSDLWVFREFLSLWSMRIDTVEIWVMKEYKVHSSWSMALVLRIDAIPTQYFSPICCTNSGDIIGTDGSTGGLVKYDDRGRLLEHDSCGIEQYGFEVAMYVESLLSLPVDSVQA